jgi:hypothetical protein
MNLSKIGDEMLASRRLTGNIFKIQYQANTTKDHVFVKYTDVLYSYHSPTP